MSLEYIQWARKQVLDAPFKNVLISLSFFVNKEGLCWPSHETLSFESGYSIKTVQRAIKKLTADGLIQVKSRQFKHTNVYIFPKSYPQANRSHSPVYKNKHDSQSNKHDSQSSQTGQRVLLTINELYNNSLLNNNEPAQKLTKHLTESLSSFVKPKKSN